MKKIQNRARGIFLLLVSLMLFGCANNEVQLPPEPIPDWIASPTTDSGWTATGCVPSSSNLSNDMYSADLAAKYQIAGSLRTRVQSATGRQFFVVDRTGRRVNSGDNFEDLTQLVVNEELVGTRRVRAEYVLIDGRRLFCSQIHFDGEIEVQRAAEIVIASSPEPALINQVPERTPSIGSSCNHPYSWTSARSKIGSSGFFKGYIREISYREDIRGRPTWISIGNSFPDTNRLGLVIWGNYRANFNFIEELLGQEVCVFGTVDSFRGVPQIELQEMNQIIIIR